MAAASDAGLWSVMVGLGGVVALLGIWIWSFNKALITYVFGVVAVAGVALPDWKVFDRGFLEWTSPLPWIPRQDSEPDAWGFRIYPLRVGFYSVVYGYGFYQWWKYMISQLHSSC